jgi:hypothetical protein
MWWCHAHNGSGQATTACGITITVGKGTCQGRASVSNSPMLNNNGCVMDIDTEKVSSLTNSETTMITH